MQLLCCHRSWRRARKCDKFLTLFSSTEGIFPSGRKIAAFSRIRFVDGEKFEVLKNPTLKSVFMTFVWRRNELLHCFNSSPQKNYGRKEKEKSQRKFFFLFFLSLSTLAFGFIHPMIQAINTMACRVRKWMSLIYVFDFHRSSIQLPPVFSSLFRPWGEKLDRMMKTKNLTLNSVSRKPAHTHTTQRYVDSAKTAEHFVYFLWSPFVYGLV